MLLLISRINKNIIYQHDYKLIWLIPKYTTHEINEIIVCVDLPKWPNQPLIRSILSPECCLLNAIGSNSKLMKLGHEVQLGKFPRSTKFIEQIIYTRQRILVLSSQLVQLSLISENPKRSIRFHRENYRCSLLRSTPMYKSPPQQISNLNLQLPMLPRRHLPNM